MQNKFGTPPSRPPLKPKQSTSWWLIIILLQGLTLLLVGKPFVSGLSGTKDGAAQQSGTPTEAAASVGVTPTISAEEPKATDLTFEKPQPFDFNQLVEIPFTMENIKRGDITFELLKKDNTPLLKADGSPYSQKDLGSSPNTGKVTLPASTFVGEFTIRAIDKKHNSKLDETSFTVNPPAQPALDKLFEIRPHIKIGEQYILLPGISTIRPIDPAWQIDATALADTGTFDGSILVVKGDDPATTEIVEGFNRDRPLFPISVIMQGVFYSDGKPYKHTVEIPLLAQTPLPAGTAGPLLNYDVFERKFPGKPDEKSKSDNKILDNIDKFVVSGNIFSFGGPFKDDASGKEYLMVIVIGNFNTGITGINDNFKQIKDNYTNQTEPYILPSQDVIGVKKPSDLAFSNPGNLAFFVDDATSANIQQGVEGAKFYVIDVLENNRIRSVLFGVIEKK